MVFIFIFVPLGLITAMYYWMKRQFTREKVRNEPIKAVLLVRKDLAMTQGKVTAQAMHAAYAAGCVANSNAIARKWKEFGSKKVTLRVDSESQMEDITNQAKKKGIPVFPIIDAGRTQVDPNTWTVTLIGPYYEADLDQLTGQLKLL